MNHNDKVDIIDLDSKVHRVFHVDARELELYHGWKPVAPLIDSLIK